MIRNLSETLQKILTQPGLPPQLAGAQIIFDRPSEPFPPSSHTAVDLFLYDIRENMALRSNEPIVERLNGEARIRRPPRRVVCSYLVTAWPVGGEELVFQEHRLLSQVLQVLSGYPTIPAPFLQNSSLFGQEPPLPMMTAQADGLQNPAEFWTAIGNKLRPSLTVTVTIGMEVFPPVTPPPYIVTTGVVRLGERTAPNEEAISPPTQQTFFWIGGRVTKADNAPVEGAKVTLVEPGLVAQTGADGNYTLGSIPQGSYTLRVQSGTTTRDVTVTIPAPDRSHYNVQIEANS